MTLRLILKAIVRHLQSTRGVGHTTAMIRGAQNVEEVIVVAENQHYADLLQRKLPSADVVSLGGITRMGGVRKPLVVDNEALLNLLHSALLEIERLDIKLRDKHTG